MILGITAVMSGERWEAGVSWVRLLSLWLELDGEEEGGPEKVVYRGFR